MCDSPETILEHQGPRSPTILTNLTRLELNFSYQGPSPAPHDRHRW